MKKLIAFVVIIATITALLAVPASAEGSFYDDFENPPASGDLRDMEGWTFHNKDMIGKAEFVDGKLKITHPTGTQRPFPYKTYYASASNVLKFDMMMDYSNAPQQKCRLSCQFRIAGGSDRTLYDTISETHMKSGVWYEFLTIVQNNERVKMYKREKEATDGVWTLVFDKPRNGAVGTDIRRYYIGFDMNPITGCEIWFDNWMAYDELWFRNMNISLDDATIEEIADVTCGGTMKFEFDVYDPDVQFNSDLTIAGNDTTVKTIVVALDKDLKMLGCKTKNLTLKGDKNSASVELELSDDENDVNFYGKLDGGGQINFYAWNNMQPLCDPIVID